MKPNRIYVDDGLTGTNLARPGLREALAACRAGDTLVVTKLERGPGVHPLLLIDMTWRIKTRRPLV